MSESSSESSSLPPADGSGSGPEDFRLRHHRHVRRVGLVAWPLFVVFGGVGLWWLYYRLLECTRGDNQTICWYSYGAPLFLLVLALGLLVFLVFELRTFGSRLEERGVPPGPETSAGGVHRVVRHTRHGYRNLDAGHQVHVRRTFFVTVALWGCFAGFGVFYSEQPALAAILTGLAIALVAALMNRYWFR